MLTGGQMGVARNVWRDQEGQDIIEYTLLMFFIVIACISVFGNGQPAVKGIWDANTNRLAQASMAVVGN